MAEMKPIGIDQTTGQKRPVADGDSVDVGDTIELAVTWTADYSGNLVPNVQVLFPWGASPEKLSNPATLPKSVAREVSWSPNGEFLSVSSSLSPYLDIYQRTGVSFK